MAIENQDKNEGKCLWEIDCLIQFVDLLALYSLWIYYYDYQVNIWRAGLSIGVEFITVGSK